MAGGQLLIAYGPRGRRAPTSRVSWRVYAGTSRQRDSGGLGSSTEPRASAVIAQRREPVLQRLPAILGYGSEYMINRYLRPRTRRADRAAQPARDGPARLGRLQRRTFRVRLGGHAAGHGPVGRICRGPCSARPDRPAERPCCSDHRSGRTGRALAGRGGAGAGAGRVAGCLRGDLGQGLAAASGRGPRSGSSGSRSSPPTTGTERRRRGLGAPGADRYSGSSWPEPTSLRRSPSSTSR